VLERSPLLYIQEISTREGQAGIFIAKRIADGCGVIMGIEGSRADEEGGSFWREGKSNIKVLASTAGVDECTCWGRVR
jgi:hypothetical protein